MKSRNEPTSTPQNAWISEIPRANFYSISLNDAGLSKVSSSSIISGQITRFAPQSAYASNPSQLRHTTGWRMHPNQMLKIPHLVPPCVGTSSDAIKNPANKIGPEKFRGNTYHTSKTRFLFPRMWYNLQVASHSQKIRGVQTRMDVGSQDLGDWSPRSVICFMMHPSSELSPARRFEEQLQKWIPTGITLRKVTIITPDKFSTKATSPKRESWALAGFCYMIDISTTLGPPSQVSGFLKSVSSC